MAMSIDLAQLLPADWRSHLEPLLNPLDLAALSAYVAGEYETRTVYPPVGDLFTAKGRYRSVSWAGVAAYLIGCAVMIPFISTTFYTGPLAAALGFDISWMIGLVVSGAVYALFARIARVRESDAAAAALDPEEAAETAAALAAAEASDDNKPHTSAKGI